MENRSLKYWKIFAFILIVMNMALIVFLLLGGPLRRLHEPKEGDAPGKLLVDKLKFTAQQESAFDKLRNAHHDSILALQEEGRKLRKTFFDGLRSDTPDLNKDSLADKISANQRKIELITYNHFEEVKKLCSPEQKNIFNDIIQDVIESLGRPQKQGPR
jgi:periplasmic protein CpxP/Spy